MAEGRLLAQTRPLIAPKKVKGGRSPLSPPMRPLHRLGIYTQHTIRHLGSCPIIAVVGGSAPKAGRAGTTAIDLGHIVRGPAGSPQLLVQCWESERARLVQLAASAAWRSPAARRHGQQPDSRGSAMMHIRPEVLGTKARGVRTSPPDTTSRTSIQAAKLEPRRAIEAGALPGATTGLPGNRTPTHQRVVGDPFHRRACGWRVCVQGRARLPQPGLFGIEWGRMRGGLAIPRSICCSCFCGRVAQAV